MLRLRKLLYFFIIGLVIQGPVAFAMSSTNFLIPWDNVNEGGMDNGTSTNFSIRDTLGDNASGTSTSANFSLSAGYRAPEGANVLAYRIKSAATTPTPSYSSFSNGLGTVVVSSAAGFAVGDLIAVVEDVGFGEFVAIGQISNITGSTITVDGFDGDGGSMSAVPAGGNDFVYRLSSNAIAFGALTVGSEHVSVVGTSVLTSIATGYSLYVQANQILQNGSAQTIATVTDGTVSTGSEEYGAEVTGSTSFNPGTDLGVTTTQRVIQTSGVSSGSVSDKIGMIYKLSITNATNQGAYTQTAYYTLTANY